MIRFVDLRAADTGYRFAIWDTVRDRFLEYCGEQAWDTWTDCAGMMATSGVSEEYLQRVRSLCPSWALTDQPAAAPAPACDRRITDKQLDMLCELENLSDAQRVALHREFGHDFEKQHAAMIERGWAQATTGLPTKGAT